MTNLQKKSYCDCSRLCPTWAGPTIAGMSSLEQSVRFDILAALFRFLAIQWLACWISFGSIFWFQFFFISESHCFYFCPVGDSQYYMKLTFSKLGIGGIWQLSKNHCPEKGGCPKKSCPQSESCCPTMKSSPQPQRFPPSDLEVQLSATPLPTPSSCLSNCRQWCCSHSRSLTPNPTTT